VASFLICACQADNDFPVQTIEVSSTLTETTTPERNGPANITETAIFPEPATTATITLIDTPPSTSTLTASEVQDWVIERMHDNGDCQLPCFWGIMPGVTTFQVYSNLLSPLSIYLDEEFHAIRYGPGYGMGWVLVPSISMVSTEAPTNPNFPQRERGEDQGIITSISFSGGFITTGSSQEDRLFIDALENYALAQILGDLGPPNRVLLQPQIGNVYWVASDLYYDLALLYEDLGVIIFYSGPIIYPQSDGTLQHCFPYPYDSNVHIIAQSPENRLNFPGRFVERLNEYVRQRIFLDVEDATGVTVEEFYETYRNPANSNLCLTSPYAVWHSDE
jgi:hypothetical protein